MRLAIFSVIAASIIPVYAGPANSTNPIVTTKVTSSYWRATFSNPPFNIQDNAFYKAFYALVDQIATDPDVKVVVFDSSAEDFWIAHFDVINGIDAALLDGYWGNLTTLTNLPVLTIASVRGICRSGGAELAAALDIRFASNKATFGQLEVSLGSLPGGGGMALLPGMVGRGRALEIVLGSDDLDADTAAQYGWINRAIPDDKFEDFVDKFARRVASFDKAAIEAGKKTVMKRAGYPKAEEQQSDFAAAMQLLSTPNVQARLAELVKRGVQSDLEFEINLDQEALKLEGEGPWDN